VQKHPAIGSFSPVHDTAPTSVSGASFGSSPGIHPVRNSAHDTLSSRSLWTSVCITIVPLMPSEFCVRNTKPGYWRIIVLFHAITIWLLILSGKIVPRHFPISQELFTGKVVKQQIFNNVNVHQHFENVHLLTPSWPDKMDLSIPLNIPFMLS
jgi:hypothetical protein